MRHSAAAKKIRHRVYWAALFAALYLLGMQIPLPFAAATKAFLKQASHNQNLLLAFTGANYSHLTLFMLGLNPMMLAMFLVQGIGQYRFFGLSGLSTRQLLVVQQIVILLATVVQAIGFTLSFNLRQNFQENAVITLLLTSGSLLTVWMGQMNAKRGIGGALLFILLNVLSNTIGLLIKAIKQLLRLQWNYLYIVLLIAGFILLISFWSELMKAYQPLELIDTNKQSQSKPTIYPLGVNMGAPMLIMLGMVIVTLPSFLASLVPAWQAALLNSSFNLVYVLIVTPLLFYFFSFINVSPLNKAREFRALNLYFIGVHPGKPTQTYLRKKIWLVGFWGAISNTLSVLCIEFLPSMLGKLAGLATLPQTTLMLVLFIFSVSEQVELITMPRKYEKVMDKEQLEL